MQFVRKDSHFLIIMPTEDAMKRILLFYIFIFLFLTAVAKPSRIGTLRLSQPDGSAFSAKFYGDELMRIKVTEDGCAIIQDESGWWCYAEYDSYGRKYSTGCRVGGNVSADVQARSRDIPFEAISEAKSAMRAQVLNQEIEDRNLLTRIQSTRGMCSVSDIPVDKFGLVILAQFKGNNEKFRYTKQDFENMLMQDGYSLYGADGSAKEYFDAQFKGKYNFHFDVTEIVTLDKEIAYYGGNNDSGQDINPHLMIMEACQLADAEVNFAKYDQDQNGQVDNVFVFFAGEDEAEGASENQIWSHAWYVKDGAGKNLILDGVRINRYACASELRRVTDTESTMTSIGTFCHEYAHTFGLPDLYDTDYQTGGQAAGIWQSISLMDAGNYNNDGNTPPNFTSVERNYLSMNEPEVLEVSGDYILQPIDQGRYYKIDSGNDGEYYLIECRDGTGWDRYVGGTGMLVYHIDRTHGNSWYSSRYDVNLTAAERWNKYNEVNAFASHQCADLIEADGRKDSYINRDDPTFKNYLNSLQGVFFPYGNVNSLTSDSSPGFSCWGEGHIDKAVSNIAFDGKQVSFKFHSSSVGAIPTPVNISIEPFQDAAIVEFSSSFAFNGTARIQCKQSGEVIKTIDVPSYKESSWAYTLEGLDLSTSYVLIISFVVDDIDGTAGSKSFMTKRAQGSDCPYIYLAKVKRTENGAFHIGSKLPLKLFNAHKAREIRWTFDGSPVEVGPDCYYTVTRKGTLRAHVIWDDGSEEVVLKEINIGEIQDE